MRLWERWGGGFWRGCREGSGPSGLMVWAHSQSRRICSSKIVGGVEGIRGLVDEGAPKTADALSVCVDARADMIA